MQFLKRKASGEAAFDLALKGRVGLSLVETKEESQQEEQGQASKWVQRLCERKGSPEPRRCVRVR